MNTADHIQTEDPTQQQDPLSSPDQEQQDPNQQYEEDDIDYKICGELSKPSHTPISSALYS